MTLAAGVEIQLLVVSQRRLMGEAFAEALSKVLGARAAIERPSSDIEWRAFDLAFVDCTGVDECVGSELRDAHGALDELGPRTVVACEHARSPAESSQAQTDVAWMDFGVGQDELVAAFLGDDRTTAVTAHSATAGHQVQVDNPLFALTSRELEVARLVSADLGSAEIARELGISVNTVRTHLHNLMTKLGLSSRLQVAVLVKRPVDVPVSQPESGLPEA